VEYFIKHFKNQIEDLDLEKLHYLYIPKFSLFSRGLVLRRTMAETGWMKIFERSSIRAFQIELYVYFITL